MTDHLSPQDAARALGTSVRTIYRLIASGRLRALRLVRRYRIEPAALADLRAEPAVREVGWKQRNAQAVAELRRAGL